MSEMNISQRRRKRKQRKYERAGRKFAIVSTLLVHSLLLLVFFTSSVKAPPVEHQQLVIEMLPDNIEQPVVKPISVKAGNEPKSEITTPNNDVRLVQRAQGAKVAENAPKNSAASELGPDGDVPKYEPPKKPEINKRALFTAPKHNRDSLAEQTSASISNALAAGHTQGNTTVGNTEGELLAKLKGRNVQGSLPIPAYNINKGGKVVVKIFVDQYGTVINAIPGAAGTTVQDKTMWEAAKQAALRAKFNISSSAETIQEGTITYTFTLK